MKKIPPILFLLIPIVSFWYLFSKYALNAPLWDDFALIDFVIKLHSQPLSFVDKLGLFFAQHNAHRIVYDRVVVYLIYFFSGKLNFVWMMFVGNISLMGLLLVLYKNLKTSSLNLWYFVPIPFLLLSLQGYENTFWGMAALQNYSVLCWVAAALYCICNNRSLKWAMFFAVLATFTSGNGMFVFIIGTLVLWIQQAKPKALMAWLLLGTASIFLYFWHYNRLPQEVLSAKFIINFFSFLGAAFADGSANYKIPLGIGLLMFLGITFLFFQDVVFSKNESGKWQISFGQSKLFIYSFIAFLMVSALLVATSHKEGLPMEETLVSRYKIYAHLLMICLYLLLIERQKIKQKVLYGTLIFAVVFNAYAHFQSFEEMAYRRRDASVSAFNFKYNGSCLMGISHAESTNKIFHNLDSLGLYKVLETIDLPSKTIAENLQLETSFFKTKLPYYTPLVNTVRIENKDLNIDESHADSGSYLVIKSNTKMYLLNAHYNSNGRKGFFTTGKHYRKGFWFEVHEPLFPADIYTLGVLNITNNKSVLALSKVQVAIKHEPN